MCGVVIIVWCCVCCVLFVLLCCVVVCLCYGMLCCVLLWCVVPVSVVCGVIAL